MGVKIEDSACKRVAPRNIESNIPMLTLRHVEKNSYVKLPSFFDTLDTLVAISVASFQLLSIPIPGSQIPSCRWLCHLLSSAMPHQSLEKIHFDKIEDEGTDVVVGKQVVAAVVAAVLDAAAERPGKLVIPVPNHRLMMSHALTTLSRAA